MTRLAPIKRFLAAAWRPIRENARKLIPSRSVRWTVIYVPAFTFGLLFALKTIGGLDDIIAYVMEMGARSLPVLIAIAITYALATGLGWNLDNTERSELQFQLSCRDPEAHKWPLSGNQVGAFLILAGEMLSILAVLYLILRAMGLLDVKP